QADLSQYVQIMNETENPRPCPACQSSLADIVGDKNNFSLVKCKKCSTVFTDRLPSSAESNDYNDYYSSSNLTVPGFIVERLRQIVLPLEKHRQNNRLLDVG